jgi:hypothetical protein
MRERAVRQARVRRGGADLVRDQLARAGMRRVALDDDRAAGSEAVSPPAVENASGKLLAPKTATGPIGTSMRRTSGRGIGLASGSGVSMIAST